jgi:hypothetical protein
MCHRYPGGYAGAALPAFTVAWSAVLASMIAACALCAVGGNAVCHFGWCGCARGVTKGDKVELGDLGTPFWIMKIKKNVQERNFILWISHFFFNLGRMLTNASAMFIDKSGKCSLNARLLFSASDIGPQPRIC